MAAPASKELNVEPSETTKRNRRLQYLRSTPEYFSTLHELADDFANPIAQEADDPIGGPISKHLLAFYDADRRAQQALSQASNLVEEESDDETADDKARRTAVEQVLSGQAENFPYRQVDYDASLGVNVTSTRDQEETYFGSEPASESVTDTGKQDY
ncbi:hypothetical protein BCR37DRAFT_379757 [Protomyces lactucae-debilis]|uniref:Uncharacterized protein n=1 Tax=Protomyces lactucae-debilis TaxID=2754530 RepID=A0A1Y2FEY9_PROLT|nr:uncharacterized protein BCR37DRAFT_379757 [Protomyces lactucae-debilis]ORY81866.1 hypothetical protein BCR37DRAFT_379757 [Protomyces lactucae-debilis]